MNNLRCRFLFPRSTVINVDIQKKSLKEVFVEKRIVVVLDCTFYENFTTERKTKFTMPIVVSNFGKTKILPLILQKKVDVIDVKLITIRVIRN